MIVNVRSLIMPLILLCQPQFASAASGLEFIPPIIYAITDKHVRDNSIIFSNTSDINFDKDSYSSEVLVDTIGENGPFTGYKTENICFYKAGSKTTYPIYGFNVRSNKDELIVESTRDGSSENVKVFKSYYPKENYMYIPKNKMNFFVSGRLSFKIKNISYTFSSITLGQYPSNSSNKWTIAGPTCTTKSSKADDEIICVADEGNFLRFHKTDSNHIHIEVLSQNESRINVAALYKPYRECSEQMTLATENL